MEVLEHIPFNVDFDSVMKKMRQREEIVPVVKKLLEAANEVANPKALFKVSYIDHINGDEISIDKVIFNSRVLGTNLESIGRVFPHVITCGRELDQVPIAPDDPMEFFCFDVIKEMVLRSAIEYVQGYLQRTFALGKLSRIGPGSLKDWPITQQQELFTLLGNVEGKIGVSLTDSFLMTPIKSVSGMYFPTEASFESCRLCPRGECVGRRAPFDAALAAKLGLDSIYSPSLE